MAGAVAVADTETDVMGDLMPDEPTQAELDRPETTVNVVSSDDEDRAIAPDQTPRPGGDHWSRANWTDRGHGVQTCPFTQGDADAFAGVFVSHFHDDGKRCVTGCTFAGVEGSRGHVLVRADPLTIEGSLLSPECGLHGWLRDGKWVPA